jgi:hypothetical protein
MATPSPAPVEIPRRPRLHTPGFSDLLGDRLLTFDNSTATSLELLRFRREFSDAPGFEAALRKRVEELIHLRHPSIGTVRGVEWLGAGEGLALVSHHTAGRRLSEVLQDARGPAFAVELIRQLAPALAALQRQGPGIAHGLLTADRIIVTREGRLVVVEHALASAIGGLRLPAQQLQAEFGLAMPAGDDPPALDARRDVVQLGLIALSLLLGKRLEATAYPHEIKPLLDQYAREDAATSARLRDWLERALQLGAHPFAHAEEANRAFERLPPEQPAAAAPPPTTPVPPPAPVSAPVAAPATPILAASPAPAPVAASTASMPMPVGSPSPVQAPAPAAASAPASTSQDVVAPRTAPLPGKGAAVNQAVISGKARKPERGPRSSPLIRWAVALLAVVALVEGVIIAGRWLAAPVVVMGPPSPLAEFTPPPQAPLPVPLPPAAVTTTAPVAAAAPPTATPEPFAAPTPDTAPVPAPAERPAAPAPAGRFGGVRINSPVELQVFEGGVLVGSTAGPIAAANGRHVFDLVNETLGFRTRTSVEVRAGQLVSVPVTLPSGRISVNAAPWAEVAIDGKPAGQTPLANVEIPIGTHEILFRHPEFGEQRHTVVVKADEVTRVSANFRP